jgi:hypothetical protein
MRESMPKIRANTPIYAAPPRQGVQSRDMVDFLHFWVNFWQKFAILSSLTRLAILQRPVYTPYRCVAVPSCTMNTIGWYLSGSF